MKMEKRFVIACSIIFLACLLIGCEISFDKPPFSYTFRQERSNITKIEICAYEHEYDQDGGKMTPLAEIAEIDIDSFLDDIQALDCKEFVMYDSIISYGEVIIKIAYLNKETEIIGLYNIGWISSDNELIRTNYRFHYNDVSKVIAKYVDPTILADYCEYFAKMLITSQE